MAGCQSKRVWKEINILFGVCVCVFSGEYVNVTVNVNFNDDD